MDHSATCLHQSTMQASGPKLKEKCSMDAIYTIKVYYYILLDECSWGFRHNGKIEDTWCDSIGSIGSVGLLPLHTNATGSGRAFPTDEILGQVQIHYGICKCDLFFSTVLCIPVLCTILQLFNIL